MGGVGNRSGGMVWNRKSVACVQGKWLACVFRKIFAGSCRVVSRISGFVCEEKNAVEKWMEWAIGQAGCFGTGKVLLAYRESGSRW